MVLYTKIVFLRWMWYVLAMFESINFVHVCYVVCVSYKHTVLCLCSVNCGRVCMLYKKVTYFYAEQKFL